MNAADLVNLGGVGIFAFVVWQELRAARLEARQDREDQAEDRERTNAWFASIHSRLGSLGASSMEPPVASAERTKRRAAGRQRIDTPPPILGRRPPTETEK